MSGRLEVRGSASRILWIAALAAIALAAGVASVAARSAAHGRVTKVKSTFQLFDVACPSAKLCFAVGDARNSQNVSTGVVVKIPRKGSTSTRKESHAFSLRSIACPTVKLCIAVGQGTKSSGVIVPVRGGKPGKVRDVKAGLDAIRCVTRHTCWITGVTSDGKKPLVLRTDGAKVSQEYREKGRYPFLFAYGEGTTPPAPVCRTATRCIGVGTGGPNGPGVVYSLVKGKIRALHKVPGTTTLSGLDCLKPSRCQAVGAKTKGEATSAVTVAIRNGKPEKAKKSQASYLGSVGCITVRRCFAFGFAKQKDAVMPIRRGKPGKPSPIGVHVSAVDCGRASCVAVGEKGSYPHMVGVLYRFR